MVGTAGGTEESVRSGRPPLLAEIAGLTDPDSHNLNLRGPSHLLVDFDGVRTG
ncbi:hypothetical protein ACWGJ2_28345 [Streptomyces sp. NPDC054796]